MKFGTSVMAAARAVGLALVLANAVSACAQVVQSAADTWKEEVLLHDGQKIVVERSQTYGGRHEVGQSPPAKEHTIRFVLPNSNTPISWTSEYGEELGRTNFNLLALHIKQDTPYLVAEPNLCLSYNKWGRPNPPYVFFKHDGKEWLRVSISEVPVEFKAINLVVNTGRLPEIKESSKGTGYVPFESVMGINENLREPQLKMILREPLTKKKLEAMCAEMIHYKCGWISPHGDFGRKFMDSTCK